MARRIDQATLVLGSSATAVSNAADTAELALGTVTVPAGAMRANGILRIRALWTYTSSVNNKLLRVRFSGISGTAFMDVVAAAQTGGFSETTIWNKTAATQVGVSQLWTNNSGQIATATATASVDTTAATTISITGQKASAGETLTLEAYIAELILP